MRWVAFAVVMLPWPGHVLAAAALFPIFPQNVIPAYLDQPDLAYPTPWVVKIWLESDDLAEGCVYQNPDPACKTETLLITIADDVPGAKPFGYFTETGFSWRVRSISQGPNCALITLNEQARGPPYLTDEQSYWPNRESTICLSPTGIAQ